MTISTTDTRRSGPYNGNGSTTVFSVTFPFSKESTNESNILVYETVTATGVETLLEEVTDYTVSGGSITGSPETGEITMLVAPASGKTIVIIGSEPNTQGLNLTENGDQPSEAIERQFDKLTLQVQDLSERLQRAVIFTPGSNITNINVSSPVEGNILYWSDDSTIGSLDPDTVAAPIDLSATGLISCTSLTPRSYAGRTLAGSGGISITNGNGVSGNPTIALSISGLTADASPDGAADYVVTYDASAGSNKKVLINDLVTAGGGGGGGGTSLGLVHAISSKLFIN